MEILKHLSHIHTHAILMAILHVNLGLASMGLLDNPSLASSLINFLPPVDFQEEKIIPVDFQEC